MGSLEFPPIGAVEVRVVRAALDAETSALIIGPGGSEAKLHELSREPEEGLTMHAIVEDGLFKGVFSFKRRDALTEEVGFWVRTSDRRRGLVRAAWEALKAGHGPVLTAECWADNMGSRGALEAMGFKLAGMRATLHGGVARYRDQRALLRIIEGSQDDVEEAA